MWAWRRYGLYGFVYQRIVNFRQVMATLVSIEIGFERPDEYCFPDAPCIPITISIQSRGIFEPEEMTCLRGMLCNS